MKAVIIGSNSFLAGFIARRLASCGAELLLFGQEPPTEHPGPEFQPFNMPGTPPDLSRLAGADLVIYTAGAGIQPGAKEPEGLVYELNVFLPVRLFSHLASTGFAGTLVTFGSYFEIGRETEERFYTEDDLVTSGRRGLSHYAVSKRMLTRYLHAAPGLPRHFHLVLPNLYGPGENAARLIPYLILALKEEAPVNLTGGTQVRQYLHASDVAELVASLPGRDSPPGIYNLCRREPVTVRDLAMRVASIAGRPGDAERIRFGTEQRADTAMPSLLLENEKARQILNFEPQITLGQGLLTYFHHVTESP